jgi:hypothetical protein
VKATRFAFDTAEKGVVISAAGLSAVGGRHQPGFGFLALILLWLPCVKYWALHCIYGRCTHV